MTTPSGNIVFNSSTGTDANNIINRISELITDYEATNNAKLNTILAVAVQP
jgi:hypothetical protein